MNILLHGCNGRMGQVITRLAAGMSDVSITYGVDTTANPAAPFPVLQSLKDVDSAASIDVVIDFSNHAALESLLQFSMRQGAALVLCTTGYTKEEKLRIADASKTLPVFNSGNMSIGINLLVSLLKQATAQLFDEGTDHDFDVEIIEKHHNQKLDAPSGTALMLADAVNSVLETKLTPVYERESKMQKRGPNEIGMHSIRGGAIVGEHEVIFAGAGEVIELKHAALSRDVFAVGALRAARYMHGKPAGLYDMQDVLSK